MFSRVCRLKFFSTSKRDGSRTDQLVSPLFSGVGVKGVRYEFKVGPDVFQAAVPAFLLQPLVENAIKYAIEPNPDGGRIDIRAWRDGDFLKLAISDTGAGISPEESLKEGIGLASTRARLHELYGNQASFVIDHRRGVIVHITIPFRTLA